MYTITNMDIYFNKKMTKEAMPVEHIQARIDLLFLEC